MKQQALAIGHVGIDFQLPSCFAERGTQLGGESGLQGCLAPIRDRRP